MSLTDIDKISRLHAVLQPDIRKVLAELVELGKQAPWKPIVVYTLRSPQQQMDLWKQGRGLVNGRWTQTGRVVTHALPHQSAHCFGLASDIALVRDEDGHWLGDSDPAWNLIGQIVAKYPQLEWGGKWKMRDCPHIQMKDWQDFIGIARIERMRELWKP